MSTSTNRTRGLLAMAFWFVSLPLTGAAVVRTGIKTKRRGGEA